MRLSLLGFVSAVALTSDEAKNRPVAKVIAVLNQMYKDLQREGKEDEETYEKFSCWCTTNQKDLPANIQKAQDTIDQLEANIAEFTATAETLSSQITSLEKEVDENQKSLAQAQTLRREEFAEFNGEEKDALEAIRALESAITVLSKHHKEPEKSLLQSDSVQNIAMMIQDQLARHGHLLNAVITPSDRKAVDGLLQHPAGFQSYAPQSGQIFGILENMLDTFKANLTAEQQEELEKQKRFEAAKKALEEEIAVATEQISTKRRERATAKENAAVAKQDLEDTRNALSADEKSLLMVNTQCKQTDAEYEQRVRDRNTEIEAVTQAIAILDSDESHDTFHDTFKFLQVSRSRTEASQLLKRIAAKYQNPELSTLATAVRLDAFTKVKEAIDQMIADLQAEKVEEIKHKDWCTKELHGKKLQIEDKTRTVNKLEASIAGLESDIKQLKSEIETLNKEVDELTTARKRAGETRAIENQDFQKSAADQRQTLDILAKAYAVLENVFNAKKKSFVQQPVDAVEMKASPKGFDTYSQHSGGDRVLNMIDVIIQDAKTLLAETLRDENDAQVAYENFVKDSTDNIRTKSEQMVNKNKVLADTQETKVNEENNRDTTQDELDNVNDQKVQVHSSCDFTLKNFDVRQQARDEEVEALRQAKAILSGSSAGVFLQKLQ